MSEAITLAESSRLVELEEVIEKGIGTFIKVGEALAEIRDKRLYRVGFDTFEDYCREEWEMSKTQANRLVAGAAAAVNLTPMGVIPKSERQVRPLVSLPAEKQAEAWTAAVASANGAQPTAEQVTQASRPLQAAALNGTQQATVDEAEQDSERIWTAKRAFKALSKKERAAFTEWVNTARH